jgi:hypothetical protein
MAELVDPVRLRAYRNALENWRFADYIRWTEPAESWVRRELEGLTTRELGRLMFEFVAAGGRIDEVRETRPEWLEHEFHYDLRFEVEGRRVYVETRLFVQHPDDPDDPWIHVVSFHDP